MSVHGLNMTKTTRVGKGAGRKCARLGRLVRAFSSEADTGYKTIPRLVPLSDFAESESALDIHADQTAVIFLGYVGVLRYSTLRIVFLLPGFLLQPRFEHKQFRKRRIRVRRPVA